MRHGTGLLLALGVLVLDQATKWLAIEGLADRPPLAVAPFFNLVLVWNRGVSFGMLAGSGAWALTLVAAAIGAFLVVWLYRESRSVTRAALWLVLAGAVGNVIDRVRFGAVVDFLDFHAFGYHWPAFNVADSAIVIGAGLILLDSLVLSQRANPLGRGER
ncbi:signal peptidase II [Benzoatithermus flavus]|uniref:Lipoprotein signal peptidase n=1 Tax=Benzoatithermus flavus TaxID=3108223 RepID=A0ABU8XUW6_9PROT